MEIFIFVKDTAQHDQQRNDKKAKGHQQNNMDRIIGQTDQDDQLQDDPLLPIDEYKSKNFETKIGSERTFFLIF